VGVSRFVRKLCYKMATLPSLAKRGGLLLRKAVRTAVRTAVRKAVCKAVHTLLKQYTHSSTNWATQH
jgi:hypothetical protein